MFSRPSCRHPPQGKTGRHRAWGSGFCGKGSHTAPAHGAGLKRSGVERGCGGSLCLIASGLNDKKHNRLVLSRIRQELCGRCGVRTCAENVFLPGGICHPGLDWGSGLACNRIANPDSLWHSGLRPEWAGYFSLAKKQNSCNPCNSWLRKPDGVGLKGQPFAAKTPTPRRRTGLPKAVRS